MFGNRHIPAIAALAFLSCGPQQGLAQSQIERTGNGGVAAAQDTVAGMPVATLVPFGLAAIAVGVAVGVASSQGENNVTPSGSSTVTSTTTTTR